MAQNSSKNGTLFASPLIRTLLLIALIAIGAGSALAAEDALWHTVTETEIRDMGERRIQPDRFNAVQVNLDALRGSLGTAPAEWSEAAEDSPLIITLPLADGSLGRFSIVESPIMAPELGAKFPEIRTYAGQGIDDPSATVRMDLTPAGFHAMILSPRGTVYIDPYQMNDLDHYIAYRPQDNGRATGFECDYEINPAITAEIDGLMRSGERADTGDELRTYRLACAATGEYTSYHGGTVASGLAAVVTAVNRVSGIYEVETAIRMELVANNDQLIYTNSGSDPYTNNNGYTMLTQNQSNVDAVIGTSNYDIGHVFSTGGGGIANLGCVCRSGLKARGVTGLYSPTGDNFYVDYVAHEMGHQFGSNHSFNGTAGACSGNRVGSRAYEPGSGSTIMGYAGICSSHNIQYHSDPYFLHSSFDEIVLYSNNGSGNGCAATTSTGNSAPTVDAGTGGWTIPINTPFELTGSATDPEGDPLTYCWEEHDLGPGGHPSVPSGNAPIFRSFTAVDTPWRTFPKMATLLANNQQTGEILPSYTRNLNFRLVARDNRSGGAGVAYDALAMSVSADAGPFLVTYPNSTNITWLAGESRTITWDVANTDTSPINCSNVDILLSVDGGYTYPYTLASNTANDGSAGITVPAAPTMDGRIKVKAVGNVFFDLGNYDITISSLVAVPGDLPEKAFALRGNHPNPFNPHTSIGFDLYRDGPVKLSIFDLSGRKLRTLVDADLSAGEHTVTWDGKDAAGNELPSGIYLSRIEGAGGADQDKLALIR